MKKKVLIGLCSVLSLLPAVCVATDALLMGFDELTAKIRQVKEYQLLDARSAEAQRGAPIAFSTKYRKMMPIKKGLVLIVADTDAAALEIAQSIPGAAGRNVFAVQGGAETWRRVSSQTSPPSAMPDSFVIPMNTCEQGKPLQELKRNKPQQELKSN
jgi:hypothetical protein